MVSCKFMCHFVTFSIYKTLTYNHVGKHGNKVLNKQVIKIIGCEATPQLTINN
jgi:hypothetical protein